LSDIIEATEDSLTLKVVGEDRTFVFLSAYDRAELLRADRKKRRDALAENLKTSGISGVEYFGELQRFDEERSTEDTWIGFVNDPEREYDIAAVSLKITYNGEAEKIAKRVKLRLADKAKICGLVMTTRETRETTDPNLKTAIPPGYGTPETK
jgi:hypothetical protein